MSKTKTQKQHILSEIKDSLIKMKSAVFVNFFGINVKDTTGFRKKCRQNGADYLVAKKTLLKKALAESGLENFKEKEFTGEVAVIFGLADEVIPAKLVSEFAKDHEQMKILSGVLAGREIDASAVMALAKLPSKDQLIAKVVGSIAAPLSGLVGVLSGNLRKLIYVLGAIKDGQSSSGIKING